jgi:sarcosine oxidase gamma subunit
MSAQTLEVVEVAERSCFELVANALSPWAGWPTNAGAVRHAPDGSPEVLHFAPSRWLLPNPTGDLLAGAAEQSAAMLVDVEGKWQRRSLRGSGAMRLLAATADVEAMLTGRDCAALSLFDCPALVARGHGSIEVWVLSSYARFLDEQLAHALSRIRC